MIKKLLFGTLAVAAGVAAERKFKISEKVDKYLHPTVFADESFDDEQETEGDECSTNTNV